MIDSLGKLAFVQLQKGNLIFYDCGITIRTALVLTNIFLEENYY